MARITDHANILVTKDVRAAIRYWTDQVGFTIAMSVGEPCEFAIMKRDSAYVMLGLAKPEVAIVPYWKQRDHLWNAYFWVDDARAFFEELRERGAKMDYDLCTQPYGVLEFGIQDLDEHDIGFGQAVPAAEAG